MTSAVMKYEVLTTILLPLAEEFEGESRHGLALEPLCAEESEPLKECLAELIAEGWLAHCCPSNRYKLTKEGYQHFEPRLRALRILGYPQCAAD